jgi:hypothetical protein
MVRITSLVNGTVLETAIVCEAAEKPGAVVLSS